MSRLHWVRVGAAGTIGGYVAAEPVRFSRGQRVVVRSPRGLELGEVLQAASDQAPVRDAHGQILRAMTTDDELLEARLLRYRARALEHSGAWLAVRGSDLILLDVEQLFDGRTLIFHFLNDEPASDSPILKELAEEFDAQLEFAKFAETVEHGCGPGCGTEHAPSSGSGASSGSGCGNCASQGCAIAAACAPRNRPAPAN